MPSFLSSSLAPAAARTQPFVLLQSSTAQSCVDVLRFAVREATSKADGCTLLFSLLYPPSALVEQNQLSHERLQIFDWTSQVPGYSENDFDVKSQMLGTVQDAPQGPMTIVVDSGDILLSDNGSLSKTEQLLASLLSVVKSRKGSRLVIHLNTPSPLTSILTQTRFCSSFTHIIAHPTALISHLATAYLTPPPPLSPLEKFWRVFNPIAERHYESEKLVFGSDGEGSGGSEFVTELLTRGADAGYLMWLSGLEAVFTPIDGNKQATVPDNLQGTVYVGVVSSEQTPVDDASMVTGLAIVQMPFDSMASDVDNE
ncbi:hypothetical protein EVJ58_g248 [Rhodofomes roseus]|uniref:Uncharacterized protein n=1 Tax=Rhodofomes roseus TaxID=34475 RepID=A0A4Y9Z4Y5_9APHY|nr:hypothetical protein EVJ58_g248 [Rhodofomes roseus]